MRNLRLEIEYEGTGYCGWQVQRRQKAKGKRQKSIQEIIEKTLHRILQEKVRLIASGRTDSGVHAQGQVANFKTNSDMSPGKLQRALNGLLPADITISSVREVPLDFHSRFAAKSKAYRYTILNRSYPSALLKNTVYFCRYPLDIGLMLRESRVLLGRHDFKSFQASERKERDSVRTIKDLKIIKDRDLIHIEIEADGFLYNMVRNIVGTLIEIGRGRFPCGSLKKILASKNRRLAGPTAPAYGLCLFKVEYGENGVGKNGVRI
jgi:tRNA pseudouridine38-40 synthase